MSEKKIGAFGWFLGSLYALFAVSALIFVIFFITAIVSVLFNHSIWSWMNLLRFYLGAGIFAILVLYFQLIKGMLFDKRLVRNNFQF